MGLGKSLQMLSALWILYNQNALDDKKPNIEKAVIVCPLSLINNWEKEVKKWLGQRVTVMKVFSTEDRKTVNQFISTKSKLLIISYD